MIQHKDCGARLLAEPRSYRRVQEEREEREIAGDIEPQLTKTNLLLTLYVATIMPN